MNQLTQGDAERCRTKLLTETRARSPSQTSSRVLTPHHAWHYNDSIPVKQEKRSYGFSRKSWPARLSLRLTLRFSRLPLISRVKLSRRPLGMPLLSGTMGDG